MSSDLCRRVSFSDHGLQGQKGLGINTGFLIYQPGHFSHDYNLLKRQFLFLKKKSSLFLLSTEVVTDVGEDDLLTALLPCQVFTLQNFSGVGQNGAHLYVGVCLISIPSSVYYSLISTDLPRRAPPLAWDQFLSVWPIPNFIPTARIYHEIQTQISAYLAFVTSYFSQLKRSFVSRIKVSAPDI